MKINVDELQAIVDMLLTHLKNTGQQEFEIEEDFYWVVPEDVRYDSYSEPKEHTIGQLSDDMNELRMIVSGDREPVGRGLVWLAAVLAAVGRKTRV